MRAARLFAKVLGYLETYGAAVVVPALTGARRARRGADALRDIEVASGCAADYDGWLLGGIA